MPKINYKSIVYMAMMLCCTRCGDASPPPLGNGGEVNTDRWAIYYDYMLSVNRFEPYDLVVFDRVYYPDFRKIHKKTKVLAYISAGEVNSQSTDKTLLEHEGALLSGPSKWDTNVVDLGSARWHDLILAQIDDALNKGFDGVMIDTLDSPLRAAAEKSPQALEASRNEAIALIKEIRNTHPRIKIMLSGAFDLLPHVASEIDYILAENILTERNDSSGQSRLVPASTYQQMAASLRWAHDLSPDIKIYTLDYWNIHDVEGIKKIYRLQREQGFSPYVTSSDLRHFTPEPQ